MQQVNGLVSVIIPAYNAAAFIEETIASVKAQWYSPLELIVVDDGSSDKTGALAQQAGGDLVQVIVQANAGVSAARNAGLSKARGEYVVFFDADDLMTPDFLNERLALLATDPTLGFAGGIIETFPETGEDMKAVADDPVNQILYFKKGYATVPSNYVIRKSVLDEHGIQFNTKLSSTADRYYIMELARVTKGLCVHSEKGKLLYRITAHSMSHQISPRLVYDNEAFYYELVKAGLIPTHEKRKFACFYFFSLALSFAKIRHWSRFLKYLVKSFTASPLPFCLSLFKKISSSI
jgi:glycosyltransferase involved in cell wall biosynthesis